MTKRFSIEDDVCGGDLTVTVGIESRDGYDAVGVIEEIRNDAGDSRELLALDPQLQSRILTYAKALAVEHRDYAIQEYHEAMGDRAFNRGSDR